MGYGKSGLNIAFPSLLSNQLCRIDRFVSFWHTEFMVRDKEKLGEKLGTALFVATISVVSGAITSGVCYVGGTIYTAINPQDKSYSQVLTVCLPASLTIGAGYAAFVGLLALPAWIRLQRHR